MDSTVLDHLRPRVALAAVLLLSTLALPVTAQEPTGQSPVFSDVVDVRVVNIEVVVTDRQGNRVTGLGPEDFLLEVDGQEVPIDYFSEIQEGRVQERDSASGPGGLPTLEPGTEIGTSYLVFIDDSFSIARDRDRVLDRLEDQLAGLRPEDRVAIVAFDGRKIDMLTTWTTLQPEIERALRQARLRPTEGLQRISELRMQDAQRRERRDLSLLSIERFQAATGERVETPDAFIRSTLDPADVEYATRLTNQVKRSVLGAISTLRSFASPPGRKVMLLLDGGWPFSPVEYLLQDFSAEPQDVLRLGGFDTSFAARDNLFGPLVDTANLLGYTIYPVDVQGRRRTSTTDAELSTADLTTGAARSNPNPVLALSREQYVHAGLDFMAQQTGGLALKNSQRDEALQAVIRDTRTYYWLGFQPERQGDDGQHDIEVSVRGRPDLRVRAREGFVDLSRSTEVTMMVESALLLGNPPTAKPLLTRFGRPERKRGRMEVPLEVGIPMDEIALVPTQGRYRNDLEIRITVMDPNGNRSETQVDTITIDGGAPPNPGQMFYYETTLAMRKRDHRIVVAVFDPVSGAILSSTGELDSGR